MKDSDATSLRSVHKMSESAFKSFEISNGGFLKRLGSDDFNIDISNNARQSFPDTYIANGYVDVLSVDFICKNGLLHGGRVKSMITPVITEIDTEEDFKYLKFQVENSPNLLSIFS